jgi:hypothetical protein
LNSLFEPFISLFLQLFYFFAFYSHIAQNDNLAKNRGAWGIPERWNLVDMAIQDGDFLGAGMEIQLGFCGTRTIQIQCAQNNVIPGN